MFASVLIANRGEIACRIARSARRLGLRTVAVHSEADRGALHVRLCDQAVAIGAAMASESYLSIEKLIAAARGARAECIHPGYGFLSENAEFAQACAGAGIAFVGPPPQAIRDMGLKDRAKALMERAGVPVVPGYYGERQEPSFLKQKAYETGYPVLVKAVAGGGGKGMRRVDRHADFDAALESAQREAQGAFGDARVMIEKYIATPRHIEVQVFADRHGHAIHLNERDCSLQRRHQKVIEEAPAPGMTPQLRAAMGEAAVRAARAVGYEGAGTVEFIADGSRGLRADGYWFMEMNTRLQVEHPVTEAVTGLDLVEWQFRVAAGEPLPLTQDRVPLAGHAAEARIYAEDPARGFLPSTGRIAALRFAEGEGIRVDSGVEAGSTITPHYDPMIAKLIAHAPSREAALDRLALALETTVLAGPRTNIAFLAALCRLGEFRSGTFDTGTIDRNMEALAGGGDAGGAAARGAAVLLEQEAGRALAAAGRPDGEPASPWDAGDGFQLLGRRSVAMPVLVDGEPKLAQIAYEGGRAVVRVDGVSQAEDAQTVTAGDTVYVLQGGRQTAVSRARAGRSDRDAGAAAGIVRAPMHGRVLAIYVAEGDAVVQGQRIAAVEAMKMEHVLTAPRDGRVAEVTVAAGNQVPEGATIARIEPAVPPDAA